MMDWAQYTPNPAKWAQDPPRGTRMMNRDGKLFIVSEYALDAPGEIRALWFPTGVRTREYFEDFPVAGYPAKKGQDVYEVDTGYSRPFRVQLVRGGATQAEYAEIRTVPPPKVRAGVELSWSGSRGLWMKASKATKWQDVPA